MADESSSVWGDVFGLGGFVRAVTDPQMLQNAAQMMAAITESARATQRIEAKLDLLLKENGHEWSGNATALIPQRNGADGVGGYPASGGAAHDGSSATAIEAGRSRP